MNRRTPSPKALEPQARPPTEPKLAPTDPSFVTYLAVRQAMNSLRRLQERYVERQPASETQLYVCAVIVRVGRPIKMGDIAKFLCLEPQTISGLVARMEAKGLVTRVRSTSDKRQVLVDVTEAGRASWQNAMRLTQTVRRRAFAEMSLHDHVRLAGVMFGIRDMALSALGEDPAEADSLLKSVFSAEQLAPFSEMPMPMKLPRAARRSRARARASSRALR